MRIPQLCVAPLLFFFFITSAGAQTFTMTNGTVGLACGSTATFYDSGGSTGTYTNNENYTFTVCPNPTGSAIRIVISAFRTQNANDVLTIYDGVNATAQTIVSLSGSTSTTGTFTASTNNPSGCLTFKFTSDAAAGATTTNSPGWTATLNCATAVAPPKNADCVTKKTFCGGIAAFTDGNNGAGLTDLTVSNMGCLSGETQSAWYAFTTKTAGDVVFKITAAGATDDIDFAVWGPNSACPPTTAPTRCSAVCPKQSGSACCGGVLGAPCTDAAPTTENGLNTTSTDVSEAGGASKGDGFLKKLTVLAGETYLILINNASSSTNPFTMDFTGSTASFIDCPTVLPISLVDFSGLALRNKIQLVWQTASEESSAYFQVERSINGIDFESLGDRVAAAGKSHALRMYSSYDSKPNPGYNYYRLKQLDFDGQVAYSDIISVKSNVAAFSSLQAFPNPASINNSTITLEFVSNLRDQYCANITITNAIGQAVYSKSSIISEGHNSISIPNLNLSAGLYLIQVSNDRENAGFKLELK